MKKECKHIKHLLADYAIEELSPAEEKKVDHHLHACPECKEEIRVIRRIQEEADFLGQGCESLMASIDWEESAESITSHIPFKEPASMRRSPSWFTWKLLAPAVTAIFMMGIYLGYLMFYQNNPAPLPPQQAGFTPVNPAIQQASLNRMENSLTRREVAGYFKQSQMFLTDLLDTCSADDNFPWKSQLDKKQIRSLLKKNRFFHQNLDDPRLYTSKPLLKKIEWLLVEILMADDNSSCEKLREFQDYIKQERLLFKIRLVGKELTSTDI